MRFNEPTEMPSVRDLVEANDDDDGLRMPAASGLTIDSKAANGVKGDAVRIQTTVQSLLEKLQGPGIEDKECACCALSSLAGGKSAVNVGVMLECGVVRVVAPLIVDRSPIVQLSAVIALRTMSDWRDPSVCHGMIDQDLMTPLVALLKKCSFGWRPENPVPGKADSVKEVFVEAVHLLWNLCESGNRAIRIFNKEQLLPCLMPFLEFAVYGQDVTIAVAYCLHTVSEDNAEVEANLCETSNAEVIERLASMPSTDAGLGLIRVLAAGILLNMNCGRLSGYPSSTVSRILLAVSDIISVDVRPIVAALGTKLGDDEEPTDCAVQSLEWLVAAQEVALEVLINACCNDDEGEACDDVDSSDASDEMLTFDVDMDGGGEETPKFLLCVPVEVQEALASHDFLGRLTPMLCPLDTSEKCPWLKTARGKQLCKSLLNVQSRALLCVNNLTSCMEVDELGGAAKLFQLWIELGKLTFMQTAEAESSSLEASTSAMRAVVQKLAESKCRQFADRIMLADLERLCDLGRKSDDANVRCNVVRMVGSLGCLLLFVDGHENGNNESLPLTVGSFLLDAASKDAELWVQSEALDAIFDVFSDERSDAIASNLGLVDKLKQLAPGFKKKVCSSTRGHSKGLGSHAPIVATVKANLARFIRYKSNGTPKK